MPGSSATGLRYSSVNLSINTGNKTNKDPSPVPITTPIGVQNENLTKYNYHVPKELPSSKPSKISIEYPSGYPTYDTSTMPNHKPRPNPISQPSSD